MVYLLKPKQKQGLKGEQLQKVKEVKKLYRKTPSCLSSMTGLQSHWLNTSY